MSADQTAEEILAVADGSLLDLVDNLLNHGVLLQAEVILGLAGIDLIYLRLTALLCAADRLRSLGGDKPLARAPLSPLIP